MRPLLYAINLTLDGCCDHQAGMPDAESHRYASDLIAQADAIIFGRVIYQLMEEAWRPVAETGIKPDWMEEWMVPFAHTIHAAKKYVVSDSLTSVDWNAQLIRGADLEKTIKALKQEPGKSLLVSGVKLPLSLAELGLIDEYEFMIHPCLAGRGPSLFAGLSKPLQLEFVSQQAFRSGMLALRYKVRK